MVLLCAFGLSVLGQSAWADGMPAQTYAPSRSCGAGPFTGPYIGAALGWARQRDKVSFAAGSSFSDNDSSVTFGGYAGYNWQCDRLVFGVETDFNYINTDPSSGEGTVTVGSNLDWFGTVRARGGFVVHDSVLLYVTGGLAYANVDHTFSDTDAAGTGLSFSASNSSTETGWTIGGGAEFLHSERWLLRAEALYVDLGDENRTYTIGDPCIADCVADAKWDDNFWVVRLGLTYKFGHREEVVPLK
jgi:outer membrane immunogenic protein